MALAAKSTIDIKGTDSTGKAFKSAEGNAQGLSRQLTSIADKSGDSERALLGLKDILGGMGGPVQTLADYAGGFEGIIKGWGGPISLAVAGVAALSAGLYKLWQSSEENHKKRVDTLVAENDAWLQNKQALSQMMGLERDALTISKERLTAEAAQVELIKLGDAYAKTLSERVRAVNEHDKERVASLDKQLSTMQQQASVMAGQVKYAQQLEATDKARAALRASAASEADIEAKKIERMTDVPEKLALLESRRMARERKLADDRKALREQEAAGMGWLAEKYRSSAGVVIDANEAETKKIVEYTAEKKRLADEEFAVEDELMRIAKMGEEYRDKIVAQREAATAKGRAAAEARKRQLKELEEAENRYAKAFADAAVDRLKAIVAEAKWQQKLIDTNRQAMEQAEDRILSAKQRLAGPDGDPEAKRQQLWLRNQQERAEVERRNDLTREARKQQIRALDMEWAATDKELRDEAAKKDEQVTRQREDNALSLARVGIDALEKMGLAERASAALKAALAGAEAALALARQDYVGAAAGAVAAAQFGAIAVGGSGGSSGTGAQGAGGSGAGGTTFGGAQTMDRSSDRGGGAVTINFSRGFVVGNAQDVGKAVNGALKSIKGTGVPKMQAA